MIGEEIDTLFLPRQFGDEGGWRCYVFQVRINPFDQGNANLNVCSTFSQSDKVGKDQFIADAGVLLVFIGIDQF